MALLTKPVAPMNTLMTSSIDPNNATKTINTPVTQIDNYIKDFYEYQHELKNYIKSKVKYNYSLTKCFTIIIRQCSPDIEQLLKSEETYGSLKNTYDSIGLMKLLEKVCYSYHAH